MMPNRLLTRGPPLLLAAMLGMYNGGAEAFSFDDYEREEQRAERRDAQAQRRYLDRLRSVECPARTLAKKVVLVVTQDHSFRSPYWVTRERGYEPMFLEINAALGKRGFRTFTQEQIRAQIAHAERDAVAVGDVDAALSAADRLDADLVLNVDIRSVASVNAVYRVHEVSVSLRFDLRDRDGRFVSSVSRSDASYSGTDTFPAAMRIVRQHADSVAAQLYYDLCQMESRSTNAGTRAQ